MSLLLFDIDGTLLASGGAGVRGMARAFERVFGVAQAFDGIEVSGRTDTFLLARALANAGLADTAAAHAAFRHAYLQVLPEEIVQRGSGRHGVMPGVRELLAALAAIDGAHLALLTGNYAIAATIKLRHFGLAEYFAWGAFGEEAIDRGELARLAVARARQRAIPADACARAVVIGDTPHDIACAHACGARALAVATGSYSVDDLRAAGADLAVEDLSDTDAILAALDLASRAHQ